MTIYNLPNTGATTITGNLFATTGYAASNMTGRTMFNSIDISKELWVDGVRFDSEVLKRLLEREQREQELRGKFPVLDEYYQTYQTILKLCESAIAETSKDT